MVDFHARLNGDDLKKKLQDNFLQLLSLVFVILGDSAKDCQYSSEQK